MHSVFAGIVALAAIAAPNADRTDCTTIGERYAAAIAKVNEVVEAYRACVAASDKRDDCAAQMDALDNAHDEFTDTVADAKECQ